MTFQQLLESEGYRTCSYSGRGMCGETCLGVRVDSVHEAAFEIEELVASSGVEAPRRMRRDQMGLKCILYWPGTDYQPSEVEVEE